MLSNRAFEKQLKVRDPYLFLGSDDHGYWTIWWRKGDRFGAERVMRLYRAPSHSVLEDLDKMNSRNWESDWLSKIDVHNASVQDKREEEMGDYMEYITKDTSKIWQGAFDK